MDIGVAGFLRSKTLTFYDMIPQFNRLPEQRWNAQFDQRRLIDNTFMRLGSAKHYCGQ